MEYALINQMALAGGTDKSENGHNYTGIYYRYFGPIRHRQLKFLEIGIYTGASVKMWESYFPNAELHFIDVTDQYLTYRSNRSKYHFFDQSNEQKLQEFAMEIGVKFDIIIDDGGHGNDQIIKSFEALFPFLNENGGIYVIEDLHTAYWDCYGGTAIVNNNRTGYIITDPGTLPGSSINFLKDLVDEVNFVGANTGFGSSKHVTPELRQNMSEYARHIESLHFYNSICFITKKP
uniref:Uncharacterized protein n=1 Tax=Meloidogyne enterolobii TaxID=390850 RepID=A0A6V7W1X9_MELEN|nr:unnamed protein product [Meloidogyne enterolobii]